MADKAWRVSTYTGANGGNCVEVGQSAPLVLVRDSKARDGAVLTVSADAWERFTDRLK